MCFFNVFVDVFLQAEVEETLKRIQTHKGVIGTIVVNAEGKLMHTIAQFFGHFAISPAGQIS